MTGRDLLAVRPAEKLDPDLVVRQVRVLISNGLFDPFTEEFQKLTGALQPLLGRPRPPDADLDLLRLRVRVLRERIYASML